MYVVLFSHSNNKIYYLIKPETWKIDPYWINGQFLKTAQIGYNPLTLHEQNSFPTYHLPGEGTGKEMMHSPAWQKWTRLGSYLVSEFQDGFHVCSLTVG